MQRHVSAEMVCACRFAGNFSDATRQGTWRTENKEDIDYRYPVGFWKFVRVRTRIKVICNDRMVHTIEKPVISRVPRT